MLYSEFLKGTKAKDCAETYEQYELIEQFYMCCETMSKKEAYKIWKTTFGKSNLAKAN